MKMLALVGGAVLAAVAVPASAAVQVIASNIDFTTTPVTFGVTSGDTFTLSYDSRFFFDTDPVLVQTTGNAAVRTVFGNPSVSFFTPADTFGPDTLGGYGSFSDPTRISFSFNDSDLGLRYSIGTDDFYGYARFSGGNLIQVAFETTPNTAIVGGAVPAVPEPASWAMMVGGFGAMGTAMRRRRARQSVAA